MDMASASLRSLRLAMHTIPAIEPPLEYVLNQELLFVSDHAIAVRVTRILGVLGHIGRKWQSSPKKLDK